MKNYEGFFIIDAGLSEEQRKEALDVIQQAITKNGGTIKNSRSEGMKVLAYPILKKTEGFYEIIDFEADPASIVILRKAYKLNESILRYVIAKAE